MFYWITKYTFDADKPVFGPFSTFDEAWNNMYASAQNEMKICKEENELNSTLTADKDAGEINLESVFYDGDDVTDVTELFIIEIK
jgi:hypothetical protein